MFKWQACRNRVAEREGRGAVAAQIFAKVDPVLSVNYSEKKKIAKKGKKKKKTVQISRKLSGNITLVPFI